MDLEIKRFLEERNITTLCHFTRVSNLQSILTHGLISIDILKSRNLIYSNNDDYRYDNKTNAICTSITFPNYRMFYSYWSNTSEEYCVLELDAKILYEKDCLFCATNAANSNETSRSDFEKRGLNGLEKLFYDDKYTISWGLGKEYTTDPQAEVLVLEDIEVNYIKYVSFRNKNTKFPWNNFPQISFLEKSGLFSSRVDYKNWR